MMFEAKYVPFQLCSTLLDRQNKKEKETEGVGSVTYHLEEKSNEAKGDKHRGLNPNETKQNKRSKIKYLQGRKVRSYSTFRESKILSSHLSAQNLFSSNGFVKISAN